MGARLFGALMVGLVGSLVLGDAVGALPSQGGFTVRPAHTDPNDPETQAYFKKSIVPGGNATDQIIVGNISDEPISFAVSAVDGLTAQTSGAVYANRQDPVRKAGAWASVAAKPVTVAAHSEQRIDFTVHAPSDATPGDHLLGLAVENLAPKKSTGDFQVTQVLRVVVGVLVRVPGAAVPHVLVENPRIQQLDGPGTGAVVVRLTDDGSLLFKPDVTITLHGPGGYQKALSHKLDTLLPGDPIDFPFPWPDELQPGRYDIDVAVIADGTTANASATTELTSPLRANTPSGGDVSAARTTVSNNASGGSTPAWMFAVVIVVSMLFAIGAFIAASRLRGRFARRDDNTKDVDRLLAEKRREWAASRIATTAHHANESATGAEVESASI